MIFQNRENRAVRWVIGVVGAAAVLGALFGLSQPLSLQVVDRTGIPIACGTGFHPDYGFAAYEDVVNRDLHTRFGAPYEKSNYTTQCDAIAVTRRSIAYPVLIFGGALLCTTLLLSLRAAGYVNLSRSSDTQPEATGQKDSPAPVPVRFVDDLDCVRSSLGVRVQH